MGNTQFPVQRCQYCGSTNIGLGWQHGEALVTFKKHSLRGNRLQYLICRRCGLALEIRNLNALCRALASGIEKDLSG